LTAQAVGLGLQAAVEAEQQDAAGPQPWAAVALPWNSQRERM